MTMTSKEAGLWLLMAMTGLGVSMMDWPQSEEDLYDYEVSLPGGAT
ncbi:MAG: hypothetical protein PVI24_18440 [Myxococcales bacterium]|jgi:hypothetical protein